MFIIDEIKLNSLNNCVTLSDNYFYYNSETEFQARAYELKNFVINLEDKTSWSWTKVVGGTPVCGKGLCVSDSNMIYYNEIYFVNNILKHSLFYKGFSKGFIVKEGVFKKNFSFNLEPFILPRSLVHYQLNNISYNYVRARPYFGFLAEIKAVLAQRVELKSNFLSTAFSADKFKVVNFFRVSNFSKKNKIFLLTLYHRIKRRHLLTLCGAKKKLKRGRSLRSRYKLLKNAILKRLKKGDLPFFEKLKVLKKRFLAKKRVPAKKKFLKKRIVFLQMQRFRSGGLAFSRKLSANNCKVLKKFLKKRKTNSNTVLPCNYSARVLSSVFSSAVVKRKKKIGYFFKKWLYK